MVIADQAQARFYQIEEIGGAMHIVAEMKNPSIAAAVIALSACASEPMPSPPDRPTGNRVCVPVQDLSEWEPVDEFSIIVISPDSSRAYLLRLTWPIAGLETAENVDVVDADHDDQICPAGPDGVVIAGCDCGPTQIGSIRRLDVIPPTNAL